MASIIKVGGKWRAQVRRKGFPVETKTFDVKAQAAAWAAKTEADMIAMKHQDVRIIAKMTLADLISRYFEEIEPIKPFGKNKKSVLEMLRVKLGRKELPMLTIDALMLYIKERQAGGAGGVTIAIDLTYLKTVLDTAKNLWRLPVNVDIIAAARGNLKYMGITTKSAERERRPTADEITRLCDYLDDHSALPMRDIINFAIESAMRIEEITLLKWVDLNEADRTIIIRDRKHPRQKKGNDQEVPLLGKTFGIVQRQPKPETITPGCRIFPVRKDTVCSIFPRAKNKLGIVDLHFHDLRHEGVSRLFEQGYRIEQVSLISGHRDWKMLQRYLHLKAKDLHRD